MYLFCRWSEFVDAYKGSELRVRNEAELEHLMKVDSHVSAETMAELAVKRATVTSFGFGLKTLIKVKRVARSAVLFQPT